jgi:hypothetical protein
MNLTDRKHILEAVFDHRYESAKSHFVVPFLTNEVLQQSNLDDLKNKIFNKILNEDEEFEPMVEATIHAAEMCALKSLVGYLKAFVEDWNEQAKGTCHLVIDMNIQLKEQNG